MALLEKLKMLFLGVEVVALSVLQYDLLIVTKRVDVKGSNQISSSSATRCGICGMNA